MFIYQSLLEAFTCGITEIDVSKFGKENQKLLKPNQKGTNKNGYQLQFEVRYLLSLIFPLSGSKHYIFLCEVDTKLFIF